MDLFIEQNWFIAETDLHKELTHTKLNISFSFNKSSTEKEIFNILPAFQHFYNLGVMSGKKQKLQEIHSILEIK